MFSLQYIVKANNKKLIADIMYMGWTTTTPLERILTALYLEKKLYPKVNFYKK